MPRKKKGDKNVMVIGSMVVSVDGAADGSGDTYELTTTAGKPWLPKVRTEVEYEEMEQQGVDDEGEAIMKAVTKKREVSGCYERVAFFVWDVFEDTEGSQISSYINFWIMTLIVVSAIVAIIETIPAIHKDWETAWNACETFFVINFSMEFVNRAWSCPNKKEFMSTVMNYVDIIAILPWYIDQFSKLADSGSGGPNFGFLRILRLGRAFRLVKLGKYSQGIRLVTNAMVNSVDALQLFALLLVLVLVVFSSGIYYTERGVWVPECDNVVDMCVKNEIPNDCTNEWRQLWGCSSPPCQTECWPGGANWQWKGYANCTASTNTCIQHRYYRRDTQIGGNEKLENYPSPFQSIPQSFWWCIVTLTTVGYGDMYPYSAMGKTIGVLCMLVGLIMLALPLSIIGTNFIEERNIMVEENKRRAEEENAKDGTDVTEDKEIPKFSIRSDLRQLLAKADQLHDSTGFMVQQLSACAALLKDMRSTVIKGGNVRASSPGSGKGSGTGNEVAIEMARHNPAPVYAVPTEQMEELKMLCLSVLQKAICEMKIWDPQGDLPEMPSQIATLLNMAREKGIDPEKTTDGMNWNQRLVLYEQASGVEPGTSVKPKSEDGGGGTGEESRSCIG